MLFLGGYVGRVRIPDKKLSVLLLKRRKHRALQIVSLFIDGLLALRVYAFFHGDFRSKQNYICYASSSRPSVSSEAIYPFNMAM